MKRVLTSQIVRYLFFGILTTVVNVLVFSLCMSYLHINYRFATTIAWVVSVLFAYVTNSRYVFPSTNKNYRPVLLELISFVKYRLLSYILDVILMIVLIEFMYAGELLSKIITNITVIIFNFVASKFIVFKSM